MLRVRRILRLVAVSLVALSPRPDAVVAGQGELVIHKQGTKLYHRPHCPSISGMAGVVAMTRAQAEGRGYKAHADCDPANPQALAPEGAAPPAETVYLDGSKYYHRKTCKLLDPEKVKPAALETAGKAQWPCPTCKPPVRKRMRK